MNASRGNAIEGAPEQTRLGLDPEALVAGDKALMLYAHGLGGLMITVVASVFLVWMVGRPACMPALLAWLAVMLIAVTCRGIDVLILHPIRRQRRLDGHREITYFSAGVLASGLVWASFPPLFYSQIGDTGRAASAVVLSAMAGGAATVLGPSLRLAILYCTLELLPGSVMFWLVPGRENAFFAVLGLAMLVAMIVSSRLSSRSVVGALRLNRANQILVAETEEHRQRAEAMNRDLEYAQVALHESNDSLELRIEARTADLAREMAERQRYADALACLASTDSLTGLCNRATFVQHLARMLAQAECDGTKLGVLFLDLDSFKQVNDVRGHATGDVVLQTTARLLREAAGPVVQIARWGGDEFVMAMPIIDGPEEAVQLGDTLRRILEAPMHAGLEKVRVDVTIGISVFPSDGRTQDELIRAADVAMYEGKNAGRGRVNLFDPALARNVAEKHMLEQALRGAIERSELSLVYQPILSARTGRCEAFEALLRWDRYGFGAVSPMTFIPVAEQSGQIGKIGRWVLREACLAAAGWHSEQAVTVNVSVAQVLSGTLIDDVQAALALADLPARRLQLEITESMFVSDHVRVAPLFEELRGCGIKILLDDFGTGFSSLAYLAKLPLDVIKIDQSFVRAAENDGYAVVGAILSIAQAFGLEVTAEGVETQVQQDRLTVLGVHRLQGYLLGRPMPQQAVPEWLAAHGPSSHRVAGSGRFARRA